MDTFPVKLRRPEGLEFQDLAERRGNFVLKRIISVAGTCFLYPLAQFGLLIIVKIVVFTMAQEVREEGREGISPDRKVAV